MSASGSTSAVAKAPLLALPPDPSVPYWHASDGTRLSYSDVTKGMKGEERERYDREHRQATFRIIEAGMRERRAGRDREARELLTHASRLCCEPLGQWPAWATSPAP